MDEQVVASLLEAEVEVARTVAGGDPYARLRHPDPARIRPEVRGAGDLDVVSTLDAGR